jgi:hypothetical protein
MVAMSPFVAAVPTGGQIAMNGAPTGTPTPTATPTPTPEPTATPTPTPEPTATDESTDGTVEWSVVTEQWEDRIQVIILTEDIPEDVAAFEVRGVTMETELDPSASPPAGEGQLTKPATVEVVVVYEDGSKTTIYSETFE